MALPDPEGELRAFQEKEKGRAVLKVFIWVLIIDALVIALYFILAKPLDGMRLHSSSPWLSSLLLPGFTTSGRSRRSNGDFSLFNRGVIFSFQPDRDFQIAIAITLAIKNRSGKIADRFSFHNRIPISGSKSILDFHFQIGSRLKTGFRTTSTDGTINRIPIFM